MADEQPTAEQLAARQLAAEQRNTDRRKRAAKLLVGTSGLIIGAGVFFAVQTENSGAMAAFSWFVYAALFMLFMMFAGWGATGDWARGIFIDGRNRYSLSRLQILLWTTVSLASIYACLTWNLSQPDLGSLTKAFDFTIPEALWALMGISATSMAASPFILKVREDNAAAASEGDGQPALLAANETPKDARFIDLFMGEEEAHKDFIDISRVQMFFFTIVSVVGYAFMVIGTLHAATECIETLPEFSTGLIALIGISNAGYLTLKTVNKPKGKK